MFSYFKKQKYDFICLQEAYILDKDFDQWKTEWGGEMFYVPGTNHSKGLILLIRKGLDVSNITVTKENERILLINFTFKDKDFVLLNIYGPNADNEKRNFLRQIQECINKCPNNSYVITVGDANLVLDNSKDVIAGNPHDSELVRSFNQLLTETDLFDIWRIMHDNEREFTWSNNRSPWIARRLDYILGNSLVVEKSIACEIVTVEKTDHRGVELELQLDDIQRGPSYWKFNQSLLKDPHYLEMINRKIDLLANAFEDFPPQMKWDYCKIQIKEATIGYSKQKAIHRKNEIAKLRSHLRNLQMELTHSTDRDIQFQNNLIDQVNDSKLALDMYALYEAKGAQTRARVKWIEEGEKNTKYFLGLEKSNQTAKTMVALKDTNGQIYTNKDDIIRIQQQFYQNLYSEKFQFRERVADFEDYCSDIEIPQLSNQEKASCEGVVTEGELSLALSRMKNDSAPGLDGLPTSFYKVFWARIKYLLIASYEEAFRVGAMSISQKRAVLRLLHKGKNLPKEELGNWRPISLTNSDYKILAKALALRMQGVIKTVICEDQVGYIKGRNISTIIRIIDDTIEYVKIHNLSGVVMALDYKKAFDSVNKDFIYATFDKFGFGSDFKRWVQVLMQGTESCINYNGWLTDFFPVSSGIRQGCPFSPLAFILSVELLAIKIRQSNNIVGINLPHPEHQKTVKITQFADDGTLLLNGREDIRQALLVINNFTFISGLELNYNKTEAMWIGCNRESREKVGHIRWHLGDSTIKILGVYFSNYRTASELEINWTNRIETILRIIKSWEKRNLSLLGKVQIIKTFVLSQFIYIMQALAIPEKVLIEINRIIHKFIWKKKYNNKRAFEKVKRDVLCQDYKDGGIKMINVLDMQNSFHMKWLQRIYMNQDALYSSVPIYYLEKLGRGLSVLNSNVPAKDFIGLVNVKSHFWSRTLSVWLDLKYKSTPTFDAEMLVEFERGNQVIWNNKLFLYRNKVLFMKNLVAAGLIHFQDLFVDGEFITVDQLENRVGRDPRLIFQHNALMNAVPLHWRQGHLVDRVGVRTPALGEMQISGISPKNVRQIYTKLRKKIPCCANFWNRKYPEINIADEIFMLPIKTTSEVRLRLLQWKIIHNIYPTRILLNKMGLSENANCKYCPNERDYIEHFFCNCQNVLELWRHVEDLVNGTLGYTITFSEQQKLFGIADEAFLFAHKVNNMILIAKMCISKFKYGDHTDIVALFKYEMQLRKIL